MQLSWTVHFLEKGYDGWYISLAMFLPKNKFWYNSILSKENWMRLCNITFIHSINITQMLYV